MIGLEKMDDFGKLWLITSLFLLNQKEKENESNFKTDISMEEFVYYLLFLIILSYLVDFIFY